MRPAQNHIQIHIGNGALTGQIILPCQRTVGARQQRERLCAGSLAHGVLHAFIFGKTRRAENQAEGFVQIGV